MGRGFYVGYPSTESQGFKSYFEGGRGTVGMVEEEVRNRLDCLYGGKMDEEYMCLVYSPEECKEILSNMDIIKMLMTFPRQFRYWIVNGAVEGDKKEYWDDDCTIWFGFLELRKVFEEACINQTAVHTDF